MKQKTKNIILALFSPLLLTGVLMFIQPTAVFAAATCDTNAASADQCTGTWDYNQGVCACPGTGAGATGGSNACNPYAASQPACSGNWDYNANVCVCPGQSAGNPSGGAGSPANGGAAGGAPNSNGTVCPDGLTLTNGLCLPASSNFPNTGIAGSNTLSGLLLSIIKLLLAFAGVVAVVMLVLGGYWYMAAGGNEEMSEKGKKTIINFVLGLVVILLAYTIVTIINDTLTSTQYIK